MQHKRLFDVFRVHLIILGFLSLFTTPLVSVFTYIFELNQVNPIQNIYIGLVFTFVTVIISVVYLFSTKYKNLRTFKPAYPFFYGVLYFITFVGSLGLGVMIIYIFGEEASSLIPYVLVPTFLIGLLLLPLLGKLYFNVKYY
jgi:hypothetical protein